MKQQNMARIERLRQNALQPVISCEQFYLHFYRSYLSDPCDNRYERYARAYEAAFSGIEPIIDEEELIVGKCRYPFDEQQRAEWEALLPEALEVACHEGQDSHMAIDYELLLQKGLTGVETLIDEKLAETADPEKLDFYRCCKASLHSVMRFADRYAEKCTELAETCMDETRKAELFALAEICANVPKYPARSFYEAVQSAAFFTCCLSFAPFRFYATQQFQLGHPDRYLYPYYEADIAAGKIDREQAQLLLDCMAIQINNRVCSGLSSGYMVGGRDENGAIVANDLTEMGMQVIDDIRLVYPSVGLCFSSETPEKLLHQACTVLSHGRSHPAIFNDDVITEGLREYGVTEGQSHSYIHSTCVEITPVGSSNVWVASPYTNLPGLLLTLLDREYDSFDALLCTYKERLAVHIRANFEEEERKRYLREQKAINPLLSCFVHSCLEQGIDIEQGGAEYNWIMPSFVGMANLVDSLYVIKQLIFEQRLFDFAKLKRMLDNNFEGDELMRLRMLNSAPKYGNDIPEIDCYVGKLTQFIIAECRKYHSHLPNGRLIPSVFCWVMHEAFGRETGATPDGRKAGFPLGDGSGPCQGREHNGPTASILSSTCWDHHALIGGVAVNMKFVKKTFTEDSCKKAQALIETYLERGGFEMQVNIVDRETLLDAQKNPEQHRDLVVRVGGYSDYFTRLSREMQAEILLRTAHEV